MEPVPFREAATVQVGATGPTGGELHELLPPGPVIVALKVVEEFRAQVALALFQFEPEAISVTPAGFVIVALVATPAGVTVTLQVDPTPFRKAATVQVGAATGPTGGEEHELLPPGPETVAVKVVEEF